MKIGKKTLHFLIFLCVSAGLIAIVMLLWNALIPAILGLSAINYWQAAGLIILSRFLFGGFGHWKNVPQSKRNWEKTHRKFQNMSREQRHNFIRRRMEDFNAPEDTEEIKED